MDYNGNKNKQRLNFEELVEATGEIGFAEMIVHPIVYVSGLPRARTSEIVVFESGQIGEVMSMDDEFVEILVFSKDPVRSGTKVARKGSILEVPVGEEFLGHVINPLCHSLHPTVPAPVVERSRFIDNKAPGIDSRVKVTRPLETGVTVADLLVPLGKGQRELVIGDRKTGKTNFLLQAMYSQARQGVICIYAAIGKKKPDIRRVEEFIKNKGIGNNSLIMASSSSESVGLIYLTPYSAMAMAEYFRDIGRDVLLILDDLSIHAKYYREISLLGRRFPGRSSYPGDIFYVHSKLLERAGNFKHENGEVSITCLPVAETVEGDISGYIQTNLMSMTDGHLYFDKDMFSAGRRPAVNYFLSVTRVGRQTQSSVRWGVNRELSGFLSLYEKTQGFVHFGAELNEGIKTTLAMGEKIVSFLNQSMNKILPINLQILLFCLIWVGAWQDKDKNVVKTELERLIREYENNQEYRDKTDQLIKSSKDFNDLLGKISKKLQELTVLS